MGVEGGEGSPLREDEDQERSEDGKGSGEPSPDHPQTGQEQTRSDPGRHRKGPGRDGRYRGTKTTDLQESGHRGVRISGGWTSAWWRRRKATY